MGWGVTVPESGQIEPQVLGAGTSDTLAGTFTQILAETEGEAGDATARRAAQLDHELRDLLAAYREEAEANPFANPIQLLAVEVERRLAGNLIGEAEVGQLLQRLTGQAFVAAAERLHTRFGDCDAETNLAKLRGLIEGLSVNSEGEPVLYAQFALALERALYGFVFTAHPTFRLNAQLTRTLVQLATDHDLGGKRLAAARRRALLRVAIEAEHRPDGPIDLDTEHALAQEAIDNLHGALHLVNRVILEVARERYPTEWTELKPKLVTVASWVGYDLDGRSDIAWSRTYGKRVDAALRQTRRYRDLFMALLSAHPEAALKGASVLDPIRSRLEQSFDSLSADTRAFRTLADGSGGMEAIARGARAMAQTRADRLVDGGAFVAMLDRALEAAGDEDAEFVLGLSVLRAEACNFGFGAAHTHVRLNATQLHNAIRRQIGLGTDPDDPAHRRTYMNALNQLLDTVEPVTVSFGSVMAERSSAKRLFMMIAQMLKYVDASTPVRFLIAETETSFTLLAALYFAKLFGVADKVEITPLFETRKALERGPRVIEELLENHHYWSYVANHGRLCVQTGYSDSGRYLGQSVAAAAIERMRMRLGEALTRHAPGQIELVIFDTHGEAVGRGGHPGTLAERFDYVAPESVRRQLFEAGIAVKQETSFQGGDGYLFFFSGTAALATLTRALEFALAPPGETEDPFYGREADFVAEFFTTIQVFNERVMADPGYGLLLSTYGSNLTYPSGSRPERRQYDGGATEAAFARQLRAIPHNSVLQQMGYLANSVGGAGHAVAKNPDAFRDLLAHSPRFRRLMGVILWAARHSDIDVLRAYAGALDPTTWLDRAGQRGDPARFDGMRRVADHLEQSGVHARMAAVLRLFQGDWIDLGRQLADLTGDDALAPLAAAVDPTVRDHLHLLHAVRIALILRIYLLSMAIPDFSDRYALTAQQLHDRVLRLEVPAVLEALDEIFPRADRETLNVDFGEKATYASESSQTYEMEHERVFQPLGRLYELVRRASSGVHHILGAFG